MSSPLVQHKVTLSATNKKKMMKGEPTLLKFDQIMDGPDSIYLSKQQSRRLLRNARKQKGIKIHLSHKELKHSMIHGSGLSWKGFKRGVSHAWKAHIKPVVAPLLKKGVHAGVNFLTGAATTAIGAPELAPAISGVANRGADSLAHRLGAYGLKGGAGRGRRHAAAAHSRAGAKVTVGNMERQVSGLHPTFDYHDTRLPSAQGGSFLAV